ncbi:hypothetical protein F5Y08DRAFT_333008 [Xylaria arbuscula]|nr:hypothetical protein F5Y08DRAFT_333008 [Xylaria arbuscula]
MSSLLHLKINLPAGIWVFGVLIFTALFLVSICSIATNIVLIIKFITTDNIGFEPHTLDFPLFKNSPFKECSSLTPDPANCTAILDILTPSPDHLDQDYIRRGYCTTASYFYGYTVVPSVARPGTIGLTTFGIWTNVNMLTVVYLFPFLKRNWALYRTDSHVCKASISEVGLIHWAVAILTTAGNIIWWWVDYAEFVQNPFPNMTLSIYAWEVTVHALSWLLGVLAMVQWGAMIHALAVGRKSVLQAQGIYQEYDCTASFVTQGVGTAQCSAQQLCSDAALLGNVPFYWDFLDLITSPSSPKGDVGLGCRLLANTNLGIYLLNHSNPEAPVVVDTYCQAVHVGLSTWRYYLDVDQETRALRLAKLFSMVRKQLRNRLLA